MSKSFRDQDLSSIEMMSSSIHVASEFLRQDEVQRNELEIRGTADAVPETTSMPEGLEKNRINSRIMSPAPNSLPAIVFYSTF